MQNGTNDTFVCAIHDGDSSWVMTATLLVLAMKPGLALFELGLLRGKNSVSVVQQVMTGMMLCSLMWFVLGYSFTFGTSLGGFIGNPGSHPFLLYNGFGLNECTKFAPNIYGLVWAVFQMMFAAITPLLQTGAIAERMTFKAFLIYCALWEFFVYYFVAHWIWGGGWLGPNGYIFESGFGVIDFAGGIVIHTTAGVSSFVASYMLGPRIGFDKHHSGTTFRPYNIITASIGASLLWVGWFGFNGGSAVAASYPAALAVMNTQIAGIMSGLCWLGLHWFHHGNPSLVASLTGGIGGLAGITPATGFIPHQWALFVGFVVGVVTFYTAWFIKRRLHIDDALDVSSIHGISGIIGSLSIGFFATKAVNPGGQDGLIAGHGIQIAYQLLGVVVAAAWSIFWTVVILKGIDLTIGIRCSTEAEKVGLGYYEHAEHADAYFFKHYREFLSHHPEYVHDSDPHISSNPKQDKEIELQRRHHDENPEVQI